MNGTVWQSCSPFVLSSSKDELRALQVKARIHLFISGTVQGVFYRDSARQVARSLGITGYVQNLQDGRVELVAEGMKDALDKLVQWCHKGPPSATVESIDVSNEPYRDEFDFFDVKRGR